MKQEKKLSENEFVHEEYKKNPYPLWLWIFIIAVIIALLGGIKSWIPMSSPPKVATPSSKNAAAQSDAEEGNFLKVSNRQFSLFLWQNSAFMRVNLKKTGYLPAFQLLDKITVEPDLADKQVVAPPEILFRYHVWDRLIGDVLIPRPIPVKEFQEFIAYCEEWQPKYWAEAPVGYVKWIGQISENDGDLQGLSLIVLPLQVRQAFHGWKNYFKEGDAINALPITFGEMKVFLEAYPHYARNYWRNIFLTDVPHYLWSNFSGKFDDAAKIPPQELAPFLKVAFFNFHQSELKK